MNKRLIASSLLMLTLTAGPSDAAEPTPAWSAVVTAVHDGDTPTVRALSGPRRGQVVRVRLSCVDTPEIRWAGHWETQPRAEEARDLVKRLVLGQRVRVIQVGGESHKRPVARVILADGQDLGLLLVSSGLAWCDLRYCRVRRDAAYRQALDGASQTGLGIWADTEVQTPWDWRRKK